MNFWDNFFNRYGQHLPPGGEKEDWKTHLQQRGTPDKPYISMRFLALAYWISQSTEQLNSENVEKLSNDLGFNYNFSNHENLKNELKEIYSITLINNGYNQYIRTLALCSGKIFESFAGKIGELIKQFSIEDVLKNGFLEEKLKDFAKGKCNLQETNDDLPTLGDIVKFFSALLADCRKKGGITLEGIQQIRPLPDAIAQAIGDKLFPKGEGGQIALCPALGINAYGSIVYEFPDVCFFSEEISGDVVFFVKRSSEDSYDAAQQIVYKKTSNFWRCLSKNRKFKISSYKCIEMQSEKGYKDVTPEICRNNAMLLFKLQEKSGIAGYEFARGKVENNIFYPGDLIAKNCTYKVCFFEDRVNEVTCLRMTEDNNDSVEESFDIEKTNGIFSIPEDCEKIQIGEQVFFCKDDDIVLGKYRNSVTDPDCKTRRFLSCHEPPIHKIYRFQNCKVEYSWEDENGEQITKLYESDSREWCLPIPEECRWKKGKLLWYIDDKIKINRPVTFLEDISEDIEIVDIGEEKEVSLKFGDETEKVTVKEETEILKFKRKGFEFSYPIRRKGIWFRDDSGQLIIALKKEPPYEQGKGYQRQITEIARSDFERLECRIECDSEDFYLYRGDQSHKYTEPRKIFYDTFQLPDATGDYYAVKIDHQMYKFHIYDPIKEKVEYKKNGNDLLITICCAKSDLRQTFYLFCTPPHRQDENFAKVQLKRVKVAKNKHGKRFITLKAENFDVDLSRGLICFIAVEPAGVKEIVSSGFFIQPEGEVKALEDDCWGLREALAQKDIKKITEIMRNQDEECQTYIRNFISRLDKNVDSLSRSKNYFNAYRNCLYSLKKDEDNIDNISGYIFMADHYFKSIAGGDIYSLEARPEWDNYRGCWDPLMFDYRVFEQQKCPLIPQDFQEKLCYQLNSLSRSDKLWLYERIREKTKFEKSDGEKIQIDNLDFSFPQLIALISAIPGWKKFCKNMYKPEKIRKELVERYIILWKTLNGVRRAIIKSKEDLLNTEYASEENVALAHLSKKKDIFLWASPWAEFYSFPLENNTAKWLQYIFKKQLEDNPFLDYSGEVCCKHHQILSRNFGIQAVIRYLEALGNELHEWRKNPDLEKAQQLRENLLKLRSIDAQLRQGNLLRNLVEAYAMIAFNKELNNTNKAPQKCASKEV